MRILLLSFYFKPDLSAGSFRATALAGELSAKLGKDDELHVVTTMPNRYRSFSVETPELETRGNLHIQRIPLPPHHSGMADQSRAFSAYARAVLCKTTGERYDLVFATSSRLMTAVLGAMVAWRSKAPLYLDIRDIFPDTLSDLFAGKPQRLILPLMRMIEKRTILKARRVNLVSEGFIPYFQEIRSDILFRSFTNGIDDVFIESRFDDPRPATNRRIILYAGNIGEGQGLHRVIPAAALALEDDFEFWIVGDGGTRPKLENLLQEKGVSNVRLLDPVPRDQLIKLYAMADVLFLHLNDFPAFRKVLPSKIFEYAATGKPVLAGVGGYSRMFIENHVTNAALFDPCDSKGLVVALGKLDFSTTPRGHFVEQFARTAIIRRMAKDVLELAYMKADRLPGRAHQSQAQAQDHQQKVRV